MNPQNQQEAQATLKTIKRLEAELHQQKQVIQRLKAEYYQLTKRQPAGEHTLKIVSKDPLGKEGIRKIPFVVRNGPAVALEGLSENEVVDGVIPLMINAYGKGD